MQHFNASAFIALKPAKAKATALAMFAAAQLDAMPDWHSVALALHAAYSPKPRTPKDDTAMEDSALAGEFAPWNDLPAPGKGTAQVRGRVSIEFADGYSKTVGLVAGKGKPWSIGKAVAFAVACYQADAARRMVGHDGVLYCGEHYLPGVVAVPEIVSVISAESEHTAAGDLVWSPDAANAATRDLRAGQVDPATYVRGELGEDCALSRARFEIASRMGLMKSAAEMHMERENFAAADRVAALLFPWSTVARGGPGRQELEELEHLFDHLMPPAVEPAPVQLADAQEDTTDAAPVDPRADMHVDLETMGLAGAIVAQADSWVYHDDYAASLNPLPQIERYRLVEDALIFWPALREPCAFVDGIAVEDCETGITVSVTEAGRPEDESAPPAADCETAGAIESGASPAAIEAVAEPAPRVKPRYRFMADGSYQLVTEG